MMSLRFRNEEELHKCGLEIDPCDPSMAMPIGSQQAATTAAGLRGDTSNGHKESQNNSASVRHETILHVRSPNTDEREVMTQTSNLAVGPKSDVADPAPPTGVIVMSPAEVPDETWSMEQLLDYGREALRESEECDMLAVPLARRSVVTKFGAGHAYSILRSRLKPLGKWCSFQEEHKLPRTSVWEVVEVYEAATRDGLKADDLVDQYSTWTGILLACGLAKPRRNKVGGCVVERIEPPSDDEDDVQGDVVEGDLVVEDPDGEDLEDDLDESDDESPYAEPEGITEEIPSVTEDQIGAADLFIAAVGGLEHAARALIARSIKCDDKDAVKGAVAEMVRAARAVLTPSEITEIVIVGNAVGKANTVMTV